MSRRRSCSAALALASVLGVVLATAAPAAVTPYRVPDPVLHTLANGLVVAVHVDHRLPIVQMQLLVPAGSAMESPLEPGLASFTAGLLARGTASRSPDDLAAELARLGGSIDGAAGREVATLTGAFGSADVETGIGLLADIALHPAFPEDAVEAARGRQGNTVAQTRQDANVLADEHVFGMAFAGDPLGHPPGGILSAIGTFGSTQVQDFHRRFWRPDHALLAIAGDVDPARVFRIVDEQLGEWGGKAAPPPAAETPPASAGMRIRLVDVPGRPVSEIRMAMPGPARAAPDGEAVVLSCALLGGDAGSRLARAGAGLTPRASWAGFRDRGLIVIGTAAHDDSVLAAIHAIQRTLRGFVEHPPAEAELAAKRGRFAEGSALGFETLGGWITQWMAARAYGLPDDRLARYPDRIAAVSPTEVAAAARRWLASGPTTLVVVGPADRLRASLTSLGEVEVVSSGAAPIAVALQPSMRTDTPTAEEQKRGRAWLDLALAAHGGRATLEHIPDSVIDGAVTLGSGTQAMTGTLKEMRMLPDRYRMFTVIQNTPNQAGLHGGRGWVLGGADGDSAMVADSSETASMRLDLGSDLPHVLLAAAQPTTRLAARGREKLDRRDVDVLEAVSADGTRRVLFLDPTDHKIVAVTQLETGEGGRLAPVQRLWSDYRLVSGVWWPFNEERRILDHPVMSVRLTSVKLASGLTDADFAPPASGHK